MNIGSEKQRDRDEKVVEIEIERLHDFKKHPFKVQAGSRVCAVGSGCGCL